MGVKERSWLKKLRKPVLNATSKNAQSQDPSNMFMMLSWKMLSTQLKSLVRGSDINWTIKKLLKLFLIVEARPLLNIKPLLLVLFTRDLLVRMLSLSFQNTNFKWVVHFLIDEEERR